MAENENKEIKKAMEIIDEMSMDEKEWELYESRRLAIMDYNTNMKLFREEGIELGIKQGEKKGVKKKQLEIAKKLLDKKMSVNEIAEITGLSKEEIEKL